MGGVIDDKKLPVLMTAGVQPTLVKASSGDDMLSLEAKMQEDAAENERSAEDLSVEE